MQLVHSSFHPVQTFVQRLHTLFRKGEAFSKILHFTLCRFIIRLNFFNITCDRLEVAVLSFSTSAASARFWVLVPKYTATPIEMHEMIQGMICSIDIKLSLP